MVQATVLNEVEDTVISILKNGTPVAMAKADDWEEPSSLSALYRETGTSATTDEFTVTISSRLEDLIPARHLQIAVK